MLPLHWKSCFDRNTPHITEFATVAKSLPHSLRKAHKSLISNIFLFQYRFFRHKTHLANNIYHNTPALHRCSIWVCKYTPFAKLSKVFHGRFRR